jgi:hypothetical protein
MKSPRQTRPPLGHTLVELVTAMASGTILLTGLAAVMMIASQVAYTPSASTARLEAADAVHDLANDLRYATYFHERSLSAVEFVVTDRTGDGTAERIRYDLFVEPDGSKTLCKTVNGGTRAKLVMEVQDFQLSYVTAAKTTAISTTTDSAAAKLLYDESSMNKTRDVTAENLSAQPVNPSVLNAPGRLYWNVTHVEFQASKSGTTVQTLLVQLRSTGDPNNSPTGEVLGEVQVAESSLPSSIGWQSIPFASPIRGLQFHRNYALVLARTTTADSYPANYIAAMLRTSSTDYSPLLSNDSGASWNTSSAQMNYRIWGTYTTSGPTYNVTRNYATRVNVILQAGSASSSRVNASIPLVNTPELLSAYWRADFDANPTTLDVTRDGVVDWAMASGSFNAGTLANGLWQASGALESRPKNNFTTNTIVDVRCRNKWPGGGNGAVVQINADRQSGTHAPLIVRLQYQADDTQTLTLYGKSNDATTVQLFQRKNLPSSLIRYRLTILPANNLVNLAIEDEDQGTFSYPTFAPSSDDRFLTLYTDTSSSEFDYVEIRVPE